MVRGPFYSANGYAWSSPRDSSQEGIAMEVGAGLATAPGNPLAYGRFGQIILYISARGAPSGFGLGTLHRMVSEHGEASTDIISSCTNAVRAQHSPAATAHRGDRGLQPPRRRAGDVGGHPAPMITAFNWFQRTATARHSLRTRWMTPLVFLGLPKALVPEARKTVQQLIDALDGAK